MCLDRLRAAKRGRTATLISWSACKSGRSLLDLARLLRELEALLGREVDVVTEAGLRPRDPPAGIEQRSILSIDEKHSLK